jgi:hypothetical protein
MQFIHERLLIKNTKWAISIDVRLGRKSSVIIMQPVAWKRKYIQLHNAVCIKYNRRSRNMYSTTQ